MRECAEQVQQREKWSTNRTTKKLEFSNKWVNGFFRRHKLREVAEVKESDKELAKGGTGDVHDVDEEQELGTEGVMVDADGQSCSASL